MERVGQLGLWAGHRQYGRAWSCRTDQEQGGEKPSGGLRPRLLTAHAPPCECARLPRDTAASSPPQAQPGPRCLRLLREPGARALAGPASSRTSWPTQKESDRRGALPNPGVSCTHSPTLSSPWTSMVPTHSPSPATPSEHGPRGCAHSNGAHVPAPGRPGAVEAAAALSRGHSHGP